MPVYLPVSPWAELGSGLWILSRQMQITRLITNPVTTKLGSLSRGHYQNTEPGFLLYPRTSHPHWWLHRSLRRISAGLPCAASVFVFTKAVIWLSSLPSPSGRKKTRWPLGFKGLKRKRNCERAHITLPAWRVWYVVIQGELCRADARSAGWWRAFYETTASLNPKTKGKTSPCACTCIWLHL